MSHQKLKYPRNGSIHEKLVVVKDPRNGSIHEKLVVVKDPRDLTDSKGGGRNSCSAQRFLMLFSGCFYCNGTGCSNTKRHFKQENQNTRINKYKY